ncbi:unnamed protein product [Amoebophrya sp. A120]|nr:unnamed protein product [Amoebophrya sp. A120]|eukprot:GSA120T00011933001.1
MTTTSDCASAGHNWLSHFPDTTLLRDIPIFPAAHHAGTGRGTSASSSAHPENTTNSSSHSTDFATASSNPQPPTNVDRRSCTTRTATNATSIWHRCKQSVLSPWCQTQTLSVAELLQCGVRFLDIRVAPQVLALAGEEDVEKDTGEAQQPDLEQGPTSSFQKASGSSSGEAVGSGTTTTDRTVVNFPVAHGPWVSQTTTLETVLADIRTFLANCPSEFVVLYLREENCKSSQRRQFLEPEPVFRELWGTMRDCGVKWYNGKAPDREDTSGAGPLLFNGETRLGDVRGTCVWVGPEVVEDSFSRPDVDQLAWIPATTLINENGTNTVYRFNFEQSGLGEICDIWCTESVREANKLVETHLFQLHGETTENVNDSGEASGAAPAGAVLDLEAGSEEDTIVTASAAPASGGDAGSPFACAWPGIALDGWYYYPVWYTSRKLNKWFFEKYITNYAGHASSTTTSSSASLAPTKIGVLVLDFVTPELCAQMVKRNLKTLGRQVSSADAVTPPFDAAATAGPADVNHTVAPARDTGAPSLAEKKRSVFRVGPSYGKQEKVINLRQRLRRIPFLCQFFYPNLAHDRREKAQTLAVSVAPHKEAELLGREFRVKPYCSRHPRESFGMRYLGEGTFEIWRTDQANAGWGNDLWLEIDTS